MSLCNQDCTKCGLSELRTHVVNGIGPLDSKILFLVDFPSQEEDATGIPLKGASSQKLSSILSRLGLHISQVRISFGVRCRANLKTADGYRQPHPEEIDACSEYLSKELEQIHPNIVIPLGAGAISAILGIKKPKVGDLRGSEIFSEKYKVKVLPTLSMGAVLRSPSSEEVVTQDIRRAIESSKFPELTKIDEGQYFIIKTLDDFNKFYERIMQVEEFAFDIETSSLDFKTGKILCFSASWKEGTAIVLPLTRYIPIVKDVITIKEKKVRRKGQVEIKQVEIVEQVTEDSYEPFWGPNQQYVLMNLMAILASNIPKGGHNIKYDNKFFMQMGWKVNNVAFDTLLQHHLINENGRGSHDLKTCGIQYTTMGDYSKPLEDWFHENKVAQSKRNYARVPEEILYKYAAMDSDCCYRLKKVFDGIIAQEGMTDLFTRLTMPLNRTLTQTEFDGIRIDREYLATLKKEFETEIQQREQELKAIVGDVDLNSPKQLGKLLYEDLKLPVLKSTKKGANATDEETLTLLSTRHEVPMKIVEYRRVAKLLSTYVTSIEERLDINGRLHPEFLQHGTESGRLSSKNINIQNIPKDDKRIKKMFLPEDGNVLVEFDLKQAEIMMWAEYSRDPQMLEDIRNGLDMHRNTASLAFKIPADQVTDEQRQMAKRFSFGLLYGMGRGKLAKQNNCTEEVADQIIAAYFSRYMVAKKWLYNIVNSARKNGVVVSLFGRVRHLPGINNQDEMIKYEAEAAAKNSPVQGAASDFACNAANRVMLRFQEEGLHGKLRALIHDALLMDIPKTEFAQSTKIIKEEMERGVCGMVVPMTADGSYGPNWGEMTKL